MRNIHKTISSGTLLVLTVGVITAVGATDARGATETSADEIPELNVKVRLSDDVEALQDSFHGCPAGYFCIYPGESWNNDTPSHRYVKYGCYNLSNQIGNHYIANNQTGGAHVDFFTGYNCTGTEDHDDVPALWWSAPWNLTPVNSIRLRP